MASRALIVSAVLFASTLAHAQSATTGAIAGQVTDKTTNKPLPGITVFISSPALSDPQTAVTDDDGNYKVTELLPGVYEVTFFDEKQRVQRKNITVGANTTVSVYQAIEHDAKNANIIYIDEPPPQINVWSTDHGEKIGRDILEKIPQPGRTADVAAGSQAGAHNDGLGVAFSGSTSLENRFLVDGIDITGLTFGDVGTPVLNDFVDEIQVLTGGYNAEWGRSTGGIVNVVTKHGTNKFRGSVFGTFSPGFLTAARETTPINASSIDVVADKAYTADFGVELGGPIIKDRLWFYAGISPSFARTDFTRIVKRQRDCQKLQANGSLSICDARNSAQGGFADGAPDVDPTTGFFITEEVDRSVRSGSSHTYSAIGKLNFALRPEHQAAVSVIAVPSSNQSPGLLGLPSSGGLGTGQTIDSSARWTSKFGEGHTELEAVVAWHHSAVETGALDHTLDGQPRQVLTGGNLGQWAALGGESAATAAKCTDGGPNDPYFAITNCPMQTVPYSIGGPGQIRHDTEDRRQARVSVLQRGKLLGTHELKAGLDLEDDQKTTARLFSGGAFLENRGGQVTVTRWVALAAAGDAGGRFDQMCATPDVNDTSPTGNGVLNFACDYLGGTVGSPGTEVRGRTLNWAGFLRDSWQVLPNLTLNAGVRYEEQKLYYAENLRDHIDPLTGNEVGKIAMDLSGNFAPRFGVVWDPTKEGKSKLFLSYGRFYEAIPMDINDRSFGGEVNYQQTYNAMGPTQPCGPTDPKLGVPNGMGCLNPTQAADSERLIGSSGVLVAPGIQAQYLDEMMAGAEFQLQTNLKLGVVLQHRTLGRVIEDVSTDGAQTYVIGNPGEFSKTEEDALAAQVAMTTDPGQKARLQKQLDMYKGIRGFDKPVRDYNAIEISLARRFARGLFVQASYTYSHTEGNYPGSVSYDNGQTDPNISSQYDLIELLANRKGPLPQDRPHSLKVDAYYTKLIGTKSAVTLGTRVRMVSGIPINALGAHYLYGPDESFLLPRGSLGRTDFEHGVDAHLSYGRKFKDVSAELFLDVFNIYNRQAQFDVDATYAPAVRRSSAMAASGSANNVNPISGGTYDDLIWAKSADVNGNETSLPTAVNPNFRHTAARYAPAAAQVGFRLSF